MGDVLRMSGIGDREPGEGVELLRHLDGIPFVAVALDDCVHCRGELAPSLPRREQVDILARPVQDAVSRDGVAAGQGEPVAGCDPQSDLRQAEVNLIHSYPASA
jgi:hypothetical protein